MSDLGEQIERRISRLEGKKIKNINSLLVGILSLSLSLLIAQDTEALFNWIPVSFLLLFLWTLYSIYGSFSIFLNNLNSTREKTNEDNGQIKNIIGSEDNVSYDQGKVFFLAFEDASKSVGFIFAITLVMILYLIYTDTWPLTPKVILSIIVSLFFILLPRFNIKNNLENGLETISEFSNGPNNGSSEQLSLKQKIVIAIPITIVLFILASFVIGYLFSLYVSFRYSYDLLSAELRLIATMSILQVLAILLLSSYLSTVRVNESIDKVLFELEQKSDYRDFIKSAEVDGAIISKINNESAELLNRCRVYVFTDYQLGFIPYYVTITSEDSSFTLPGD